MGTISSPDVVAGPTPPKATGLSPQARQGIAIGGLALCLLVGAGIIYWLMIGSSPKSRTVKIDPKQAVVGARAPTEFRLSRPRDARGVSHVNGEWVVLGRTGEMRVAASTSGAGVAADAKFRFLDLKLPTNQVALLAARFRILRDPAMAKAWGVTAEQTEQLKRLDLAGGGLEPTARERGDLWEMWKMYQLAKGPGKPDAERALTEKVDALAKAHFDAARLAFDKRFQEMTRILTPEQIEKITR